MEEQECIKVTSIINEYLNQNLQFDFKVCDMHRARLILIGKTDVLCKKSIEITFIDPFFISMNMYFIYNNGGLIEFINGDEFIEKNIKYKVEKGNWQFRITPNSDSEYLIVAKGIEVKFND